MILSPVVLFTYNRPWHTQKTLEALLKNTEAAESDLIVFSDGAKDKNARPLVDEVRRYLKTVQGFRSVQVVFREQNVGVAHNIVFGVSEIVNKYGKVIVLEDDLVTSPYFLKFMNMALELYKDENKVWHISGWNYPVDTTGMADAFLWRVMNCWGWATWTDRWANYEKDPEKLIASFSREAIWRFNVDGEENFWAQVIANSEGRLNTWAIFWYATIFLNHGLCLNPSLSYVQNIGHDGSGIHCGNSGYEDNKKINLNSTIDLPETIEEDSQALATIKNYFRCQKKPFHIKVINKVFRIVSRICQSPALRSKTK